MGLAEMSDSVCESETASCTAITEKRQDHRSGGCTGILFRLFDWNRRLAKKKLFSRKLLPPSHQSKQAAKKFKGDEKMPIAKFHLMADVNNGGFSKLKKNAKGTDIVQRQEMRAPCLVARLMGLDLMPAAQRDKTKKPSSAASCNVQRHEFVAVATGGDGDIRGSHLEQGQLKHQIRPQKLQKTGLSERQAPTRFAPAGMQLKGVLSRNRKHHHPKLETPVKSPRASSARMVSRVSRSRLIDAATKILEPGLVSKDKYRFALSNPNGMICTPADEVMLVGSQICIVGQANQSNHIAAPAKDSVGHAACRNCGCLVQNKDFRPIVAARASDCAASTSDLVFAPHQSGVTLPRSYLKSVEQEKKVSCMTSQKNAVSLATRLKNESIEHNGLLRDEFLVPQNFQEHQGRTESSQKEESSSISSRHGTKYQSCPSSREERLPARAKVGNFRKRRITSAADSVNSADGFVGFNSKPTGETHEMVSAVPESSNTDADVAKISCLRRANSSSQLTKPVQKRRFIDVERLVEKPSFVSSTSRVQRNQKCCPLTGKEFEVHYYNDALIKGRSGSRAKGTAASTKSVNRAIPLAWDSSLTHMGETSTSSNAAGSFPNCSCITSNLGGVSGLKVHPDLGNKTYDHPRSFRFCNLSKQEGLHRDVVVDLYARTSKTFCYFDVARASRYGQSHAQKVAQDSELLLADGNSFRTCWLNDIRAIPFLLSKLEKSATSPLSSITGFMGSDAENRRSYLREFLLDCLIECLDSRFFCHDEFTQWKKLPMDLDTLIQDVEVEARSWASLSGMSSDEMIEWEMGHSFEKWTDFRKESLENGIAIDSYIFQSLVDEIIEDLHGACGLKCSY